MIDTEALRKKIIDLAIKGNLTQQLPEDGNAEDLYAQIQEEKSELIKEGKLKKEKPLPEVSDDEIPFEIASNWKWVRLAAIISLQSGQDLSPSDYNDETKGIPYITGASNFDSTGSVIINRWTEYPKAYAYKGYILLSCKGTVGKLTILKEDVVHIARQIMGIRSFCVDCNYLLYYLESMINDIKEAQKGLIPGIERKDILDLLCPLPPLEEQRRIVSIVVKAFSQIEIINSLQQQYESDREVLKGKIIDAGICGKLTEQLPEDGDAEDLYAQIQEEKEKNIKKGKIRKGKPLLEISDGEIPFEIPKNWKWVRMGDFCLQITDGTHRTPTYVEEGVPFLSVKNISSGKFDLSDTKCITPLEHTELIKRCRPEKNDVLICRIGTLGKAIRISIDLEFSVFVSLGLIKTLNRITSDYIVSVINSDYGTRWINENKAGGAMHTYKINLGTLSMLPIPLPPLQEQRRIVDRTQELLSLLD